MPQKKKYQIFLSSTFSDLIEERKVAIDAILQLKQIPAGMELFGAIGEEQLQYIKECILESDYYLLIIGGKYGSINREGISYTEAEYDFAVSIGMRVIAFLHEEPENLPAKRYELDPDRKRRLEEFRRKVAGERLVSFWRDISDLRLKILSSLSGVMNEFPARGWVRTPIAPEEEAEDLEDELFPFLSSVDLGKVDVSYDSSKPSRAIVRTEDAYVQLEARAGRVEDYMVDTCKSYLRLLRYNAGRLDPMERFCLRRIWFNTKSPEVVLFLDLLYDRSIGCRWTREKIKEIFYSDQVLGDGIYYAVMVRLREEFFNSDYFFENDPDYYEKPGEPPVTFDWEDSIWGTPFVKGEYTVVPCEAKLSNGGAEPVEFRMDGLFALPPSELAMGGQLSAFFRAVHAGSEAEMFSLEGHEVRRIPCLFRRQGRDLPKGKPDQIMVEPVGRTEEFE